MGAQLSGGGGGSKYTTNANSEINVTPFVDIMLVLLIIFMVSIPAATVSIKLDLPPADGRAAKEEQKEPVFISVMGAEDIYIGSKKVTLESLPGELAAALDSPTPTEERVLIRGYKDIEYQDFMQVLNTLQQYGYFKIGLINEDIE